MDNNFSRTFKEIISESRNIAIELGYDYISTLHFFLADCKLNHNYSLKNLFFDSGAAFDRFYKLRKINDLGTSMEGKSIPLTKEAEMAIRLAHKLYKSKKYYTDQVGTFHLFLACALLPQTEVYKLMNGDSGLFEKMEQYYCSLGLEKSNKGKESHFDAEEAVNELDLEYVDGGKAPLSLYLKALIEASKQAAFELGYHEASTFHFFLANCKTDQKDSLRKLFFETDDEFNEFYNLQKISNEACFKAPQYVPLSAEANIALEYAGSMVYTSEYRSYYMQPYHFFLACSLRNETVFYSIMDEKDRLLDKLELYYQQKGVLKVGWKRLREIMRS